MFSNIRSYFLSNEIRLFVEELQNTVVTRHFLCKRLIVRGLGWEKQVLVFCWKLSSTDRNILIYSPWEVRSTRYCGLAVVMKNTSVLSFPVTRPKIRLLNCEKKTMHIWYFGYFHVPEEHID